MKEPDNDAEPSLGWVGIGRVAGGNDGVDDREAGDKHDGDNGDNEPEEGGEPV